MASRLWNAYGRLLKEYPLRTKVASSTGIYFCGDLTMQKIEFDDSVRTGKSLTSKFKWDAKRTGRMCVYGGLWLSPFLHVWYRALDTLFIGRTGLAVIAGKLALDQSFAATSNMCMFYSINGVLEGLTVPQVGERLQEKLWPTMQSLWCLWIPVQVVNLTFVPLEKRVLVVNLVGLGWSVYLSWMGNKREATIEALEAGP